MRPPVFLSAAIALSSVAALTPSLPFKCQNVEVSGATYDLSSLDREWTVNGLIPLRLNPCGAIKYANEACPAKKTSMCAMDPLNPSLGRVNVGTLTQVYRNKKDELIMMFSNGDFDMNGFPFVSLIRFECDQSAGKDAGPMEPVSDGSKFFLIWKSKAACPKRLTKQPGDSDSKSLGLGSILFFLASIGLVGYFVGGAIYNFAVIGRRGVQVIPNHGFWMDLIDFFRELVINIGRRLCGASGAATGGYQQI